jgi:hypothetical protein
LTTDKEVDTNQNRTRKARVICVQSNHAEKRNKVFVSLFLDLGKKANATRMWKDVFLSFFSPDSETKLDYRTFCCFQKKKRLSHKGKNGWKR